MSYISSNFKKPKYKVTSHTTVQQTNSTAQVLVMINGSDISYIPDEYCNNVIYEISFYSEKINGLVSQYIFLEEFNGSNWVEIDPSYRRNLGYAGPTTQSGRWYTHLRFVLPAWSGNKDLRLTTGSYASNQILNLHEMSQWDGASSTNTFCNTNLLVYSV